MKLILIAGFSAWAAVELAEWAVGVQMPLPLAMFVGFGVGASVGLISRSADS